MLRLRIITACILAVFALGAVIGLPEPWLAVVFWIVAAAGCYEWAGFAGLHTPVQRVAYAGLFSLVVWFCYGNVAWYDFGLILGCSVWLAAVVAVLVFPKGQVLFQNRLFAALLGLAVLVPAWIALVVVRQQPQGSWWLIWVFFLVWGADIGAYFAGRAFGKQKLAPQVSPGKTWEGAAGGFIFAMSVCSVGLVWLSDQWLLWLPILAALIVVSVFGDLFESVLKRATGVKDSGSLLPGHGGVLDRIDSLLAVIPVFALILTWN
jgi:phosphatidate cytidylyltransferase